MGTHFPRTWSYTGNRDKLAHYFEDFEEDRDLGEEERESLPLLEGLLAGFLPAAGSSLRPFRFGEGERDPEDLEDVGLRAFRAGASRLGTSRLGEPSLAGGFLGGDRGRRGGVRERRRGGDRDRRR